VIGRDIDFSLDLEDLICADLKGSRNARKCDLLVSK